MNPLESLLGVVSPTWALKRAQAREALRSYTVGKITSHTQTWNPGQTSGNSTPAEQILRARYRAYDAYRNNHNVRKIVNAFCARVIGRGIHPDPMAVRQGVRGTTPFPEFNRRTKELWRSMSKLITGSKPGRGGMHFVQMQWQVAKSLLLSGEILTYVRPLDRRRSINLPVPVTAELIHPERLDENVTSVNNTRIPDGNSIYRGIEVAPSGQRVRYWILDNHPADFFMTSSAMNYFNSSPIPASSIVHTFFPDDIGGLRGVSLLGSALLKLRDAEDLDENELMSSAAAACVAMALEGDGPGGTLSLASPSAAFNGNSSDKDGNTLTFMQPKMFLDLRGHNAKLTGFNPNRPATNVIDFGNAMKSQAGRSVPGMKTSLITGDYKRSSFSSEQSEENDAWREVEQIQDFLNWHFNEPIYEAVVTMGIANGYYDDVPGFSAQAFRDNPENFLQANWHGPVPRSINRKDDEEASQLSIKNGTSSVQREAAQKGQNWMENLENMAEALEYAATFNDPAIEEVVKMWFGVMPQPAATNLGVAENGDESEEDAETEDSDGEEDAA